MWDGASSFFSSRLCLVWVGFLLLLWGVCVCACVVAWCKTLVFKGFVVLHVRGGDLLCTGCASMFYFCALLFPNVEERRLLMVMKRSSGRPLLGTYVFKSIFAMATFKAESLPL